MAPSAQAHHRSHSLLLLQKLLNLRDTASPLTFILDTLEQSATPLVQEFITRAKISKAKIILVSLATVKKPANIDIFIKARGKSLKDLAIEIASHVAPRPPTSKAITTTTTTTTTSSPAQQQKFLIVIDTLNPLLSTPQPHLLSTFFSSVIPPATTSLIAVYHTDVPNAVPHSVLASNPYSPPPFTVLNQLATAVLRVSSLHHAAETKRALDRSVVPPEHGLLENREGVLVGLRAAPSGSHFSPGFGGRGREIVLEMELRRKSGRIVSEKFIMISAAVGGGGGIGIGVKAGPSPQPPPKPASIMLFSDHPIFSSPQKPEQGEEEGQEMEATFNLGLTEKQRRDREGVVLPYFDAQTDVGQGGEGGRILYDIGSEDDFDEEEDEI